jgi:hypothetical protein
VDLRIRQRLLGDSPLRVPETRANRTDVRRLRRARLAELRKARRAKRDLVARAPEEPKSRSAEQALHPRTARANGPHGTGSHDAGRPVAILRQPDGDGTHDRRRVENPVAPERDDDPRRPDAPEADRPPADRLLGDRTAVLGRLRNRVPVLGDGCLEGDAEHSPLELGGAARSACEDRKQADEAETAGDSRVIPKSPQAPIVPAP